MIKEETSKLSDNLVLLQIVLLTHMRNVSNENCAYGNALSY